MFSSSRTRLFLRGAFILTSAGLCTRIIGFFYRIFLSRTFGAEGVGLYQLIFPVYALCISLTAAGIQTALSRITAKYISLGNAPYARTALRAALCCSLLPSFLCTIAVQLLAPFLCDSFLHDIRCIPLLKVMAYAFPFASVHACICGYYIGLKKTRIPAFSQLAEQCTRVLAVYILYLSAVQHSQKAGILIAVCGLVLGEIAACFYCILSIQRTFSAEKKIYKNTPSAFRGCLFELLACSAPLTANRISLNILQSIEVISIPQKLILSGLSPETALSCYGILNGIAMPCILFPSAVTNSVSVMLLPTVAEIQAANLNRQLKGLVQKVSASCILLGSACTAGFLVFAGFLGEIVFNSPEASSYIRALSFICPFLYTNSTYLGILNGLGYTSSTFLVSISGLGIRIFCVFFLIPEMGISGYLAGILLSQLFIFFSCIWKLKRSL